MDPVPGGALDQLNTYLADPAYSIVAHLAQGPTLPPGNTVVQTALVECNFPGYAAVPVQPDLSTAVDTTGYGEMSPVRLHFEAGAIVTPQLATHIYYTAQYGSGAVTLLSAVQFINPVMFALPGDFFEVDAIVNSIVVPGS